MNKSKTNEMKKLFILTAGLLTIFFTLSAQQVITSYKTTIPYGFNTPAMLDSTSNSGKNFSASDLLYPPSLPKDMPMLKTKKQV